EQVTQFVHGEQGLATAQRITHVLFAGEPTKLSVTDIKQLALDGLERYLVGIEQALSALLVTCGLAKSKRIAKQLLAEGAIKINGDIVTSDS
ncbi:S4 domain-containing protein, partial [Streptomyces scabiei]